jgi:hypothetical protein
MSRALGWAIVVIVWGAIVAAAYFFWWKPQQEAPPPPAAPPPVAEAPKAQPPAPPPVRHPIEAVQPAPSAAEKLPTLDESDAAMQDALAGILGRDAFGKFLEATDIIRRVVVTVDSLPREKTSPRLWPVKPTAGRFVVARDGDAIAIGAENARRYRPFVQLIEKADTQQLAALYVRMYPLFQQAYAGLGHQGYFNDRLIEAIDNLLAAPEVAPPIRLAQPKVMYVYADPDMEARSAGQKTLIRMGSENATRVKAKLRELRKRVASANVPQ